VKPGGPKPPAIPGKLTGAARTGLADGRTGDQQVTPGFSDVGLASLPTPPEPVLATEAPA
jgi:hypothetical protein